MKCTLDGITWNLRKCEYCDGTGMRQGRIHCLRCGGHGYIRSRTGEAMAQYQRDWRARNGARKEPPIYFDSNSLRH